MKSRIVLIVATVVMLGITGCNKPQPPAPAPSAIPVTASPDASGQVRQQITDQPVVPGK